jgi:hypothetical protein
LYHLFESIALKAKIRKCMLERPKTSLPPLGLLPKSIAFNDPNPKGQLQTLLGMSTKHVIVREGETTRTSEKCAFRQTWQLEYKTMDSQYARELTEQVFKTGIEKDYDLEWYRARRTLGNLRPAIWEPHRNQTSKKTNQRSKSDIPQ